MRSPRVWELQNEIFDMWEAGLVKGEKFKKGEVSKKGIAGLKIVLRCATDEAELAKLGGYSSAGLGERLGDGCMVGEAPSSTVEGVPVILPVSERDDGTLAQDADLAICPWVPVGASEDGMVGHSAYMSERVRRMPDGSVLAQDSVGGRSPKAITTSNGVLQVPADMPVTPWIQMGALDDDDVIQVLQKVRDRELSLEEMEQEFERIKRRNRAIDAFVKGTNSESWEDAKEKFPIHTQEPMIEQCFGDTEKSAKGTGGVILANMASLIARALKWKTQELRWQVGGYPGMALEDAYDDWVRFLIEVEEGRKERGCGIVKILQANVLEMKYRVAEQEPFSLAIFDFPCGSSVPGFAK
ncbi:hypothetical protein CBR_g51025 [Chara braunii]|uniref:Uncharacterized protein n=1 Tax=Chara braunii TaxID=69332 RepID=A0A388M7W1_CHABU|nr:hypothetical protein CBR_g51025 [Chara braunii]|eukprot:GBG90677.1 hypothetical protein CBR_g51025 [Chara braunii]